MRLQQARDRVLELISFAEAAAEDDYDCQTLEAWKAKPENKGKDPEEEGLNVLPLKYRGVVQPCIVRALMEEGSFRYRKREGQKLQEREMLDDGKAVVHEQQLEYTFAGANSSSIKDFKIRKGFRG